MRRIQLDQDIKPLSEFRANATELLKKIRETKRPLVITQRGRSSAVILDVSEYEDLLERLELLEDIYVAEKQIIEGKILEHDQAKIQVLETFKK